MNMNIDKCIIKQKNLKTKSFINNIRTNLLRNIDEECSKYLKACKIKLNNKLPKENIKEYEKTILISFNNPTITHISQKHIIHSDDKVEIPKCNKTAQVFYKHTLENEDKGFNILKKINVSDKKFEANFKKNNLQIDIDNENKNSNEIILSNKNKSTKSRTGINLSACLLKKKEIDNILKSDEEKNQEKIKINFNKLQRIANVKKTNKIQFDPISENKRSYSLKDNDGKFMFRNLENLHNDLLEALENKGINTDTKENRNSNSTLNPFTLFAKKNSDNTESNSNTNVNTGNVSPAKFKSHDSLEDFSFQSPEFIINKTQKYFNNCNYDSAFNKDLNECIEENELENRVSNSSIVESIECFKYNYSGTLNLIKCRKNDSDYSKNNDSSNLSRSSVSKNLTIKSEVSEISTDSMNRQL